MDTSQYKDEFVSEARDHLDTLNEGLLVLEKNQQDMDTINKLFRAFHTLKGNSATMGYMKFSELAHALEDILSRIRDKKLNAEKKIMDLIFEGCDILQSGLEKISSDNSDEIEAEQLIGRLHEVLGEENTIIHVEIGKHVVLNDAQQHTVSEWRQKNSNIFRVILQFPKGNVLKTAKALVVLRNLSEVSELIKTTPESDEIKMGRFDAEVELIIATSKSKEEVDHLCNTVSGLRKVIILGIDEQYEKSQQSALEEKEQAKAEIASKHQADVVQQIQSVKVNMKKLDKLMNLVGELLISNIRLQDIDKRKQYDNLKTVLTGIDRLSLDLQDEVMEIRMVPIGNIFNRFPRMVRDLAAKEGKNVNLVIEGQDIEFDRTVLDEIGDPLVHMLRNCVDHGIELPEERVNAGKPDVGTVKLVARREKNNAVIEVVDDGAGIDPQKVKEACIRKGHISAEDAARLSNMELQMLIFRPGTSTNTVVTEVSGRGVGMDVVLTKTKELGGHLSLQSEVGRGTTLTIQLPLTVAIITALLVKVNEDIFAIPLSSVDQTVDVETAQIKTIHGNEVFLLRGKEIPILWLHELMSHTKPSSAQKITLIIVNRDREQIGLVVDEIISQQQILIKGLQDIVKRTKGVAGATILGDGTVALILDIGSLF